MNLSECFEFLERHQPMPSSDGWDEECEKLDDVIKYLTDHPNIEALPLLLTVFGEGDGFGVYQTVEFAVIQYRPEVVVPLLLQTLRSPSRNIVYWNAQIAALFPDERLITPLEILVHSDDEDIQAASLMAIGQIKTPRAFVILETLNRSHLSDEIQEVLNDILDDRQQDNAS